MNEGLTNRSAEQMALNLSIDLIKDILEIVPDFLETLLDKSIFVYGEKTLLEDINFNGSATIVILPDQTAASKFQEKLRPYGAVNASAKPEWTAYVAEKLQKSGHKADYTPSSVTLVMRADDYMLAREMADELIADYEEEARKAKEEEEEEEEYERSREKTGAAEEEAGEGEEKEGEGEEEEKEEEPEEAAAEKKPKKKKKEKRTSDRRRIEDPVWKREQEAREWNERQERERRERLEREHDIAAETQEVIGMSAALSAGGEAAERLREEQRLRDEERSRLESEAERLKSARRDMDRRLSEEKIHKASLTTSQEHTKQKSLDMSGAGDSFVALESRFSRAESAEIDAKIAENYAALRQNEHKTAMYNAAKTGGSEQTVKQNIRESYDTMYSSQKQASTLRQEADRRTAETRTYFENRQEELLRGYGNAEREAARLKSRHEELNNRIESAQEVMEARKTVYENATKAEKAEPGSVQPGFFSMIQNDYQRSQQEIEQLKRSRNTVQESMEAARKDAENRRNRLQELQESYKRGAKRAESQESTRRKSADWGSGQIKAVDGNYKPGLRAEVSRPASTAERAMSSLAGGRAEVRTPNRSTAGIPIQQSTSYTRPGYTQQERPGSPAGTSTTYRPMDTNNVTGAPSHNPYTPPRDSDNTPPVSYTGDAGRDSYSSYSSGYDSSQQAGYTPDYPQNQPQSQPQNQPTQYDAQDGRHSYVDDNKQGYGESGGNSQDTDASKLGHGFGSSQDNDPSHHGWQGENNTGRGRETGGDRSTGRDEQVKPSGLQGKEQESAKPDNKTRRGFGSDRDINHGAMQAGHKSTQRENDPRQPAESRKESDGKPVYMAAGAAAAAGMPHIEGMAGGSGKTGHYDPGTQQANGHYDSGTQQASEQYNTGTQNTNGQYSESGQPGQYSNSGQQGQYAGSGPQEQYTGSGPQEQFAGAGPQEQFAGSGPQEQFAGSGQQGQYAGSGPQEQYTGAGQSGQYAGSGQPGQWPGSAGGGQRQKDSEQGKQDAGEGYGSRKTGSEASGTSETNKTGTMGGRTFGGRPGMSETGRTPWTGRPGDLGAMGVGMAGGGLGHKKKTDGAIPKDKKGGASPGSVDTIKIVSGSAQTGGNATWGSSTTLGNTERHETNDGTWKAGSGTGLGQTGPGSEGAALRGGDSEWQTSIDGVGAADRGENVTWKTNVSTEQSAIGHRPGEIVFQTNKNMLMSAGSGWVLNSNSLPKGIFAGLNPVALQRLTRRKEPASFDFYSVESSINNSDYVPHGYGEALSGQGKGMAGDMPDESEMNGSPFILKKDDSAKKDNPLKFIESLKASKENASKTGKRTMSGVTGTPMHSKLEASIMGKTATPGKGPYGRYKVQVLKSDLPLSFTSKIATYRKKNISNAFYGVLRSRALKKSLVMAGRRVLRMVKQPEGTAGGDAINMISDAASPMATYLRMRLVAYGSTERALNVFFTRNQVSALLQTMNGISAEEASAILNKSINNVMQTNFRTDQAGSVLNMDTKTLAAKFQMMIKDDMKFLKYLELNGASENLMASLFALSGDRRLDASQLRKLLKKSSLSDADRKILENLINEVKGLSGDFQTMSFGHMLGMTFKQMARGAISGTDAYSGYAQVSTIARVMYSAHSRTMEAMVKVLGKKLNLDAKTTKILNTVANPVKAVKTSAARRMTKLRHGFSENMRYRKATNSVRKVGHKINSAIKKKTAGIRSLANNRYVKGVIRKMGAPIKAAVATAKKASAAFAKVASAVSEFVSGPLIIIILIILLVLLVGGNLIDFFKYNGSDQNGNSGSNSSATSSSNSSVDGELNSSNYIFVQDTSLFNEISAELDAKNKAFDVEINNAANARYGYSYTDGFYENEDVGFYESYKVYFRDEYGNELEPNTVDFNNTKEILAMASKYIPYPFRELSDTASEEEKLADQQIRQYFKDYCLFLWAATHQITIEEYHPGDSNHKDDEDEDSKTREDAVTDTDSKGACEKDGTIYWLEEGFTHNFIKRAKSDGGTEIDTEIDDNASLSSGLQMTGSSSMSLQKTGVTLKNHYIFAGDSRFVGMKSVVTNGENETYIAKVSQGLRWFRNQMSGQTFNSNDVLIIGFGINDLHNIDEYISYINGIECPNIFWLTVNPVDEAKQAKQRYPVYNSQISQFNNKMKSSAGHYKVIDTYSALMSHGYTSPDGAHYDAATYRYIHDYVINEVSSRLGTGSSSGSSGSETGGDSSETVVNIGDTEGIKGGSDDTILYCWEGHQTEDVCSKIKITSYGDQGYALCSHPKTSNEMDGWRRTGNKKDVDWKYHYNCDGHKKSVSYHTEETSSGRTYRVNDSSVTIYCGHDYDEYIPSGHYAREGCTGTVLIKEEHRHKAYRWVYECGHHMSAAVYVTIGGLSRLPGSSEAGDVDYEYVGKYPTGKANYEYSGGGSSGEGGSGGGSSGGTGESIDLNTEGFKYLSSVGLSEEIQEYLYGVCNHYGISYAFALGTIKLESGFTAKATHHNSNGTVDRGLCQVNSCNVSWLHDLGLLNKAEDLYDPKICIDCGMYILNMCVEKYGNTERAYAYYNTGRTTVTSNKASALVWQYTQEFASQLKS